MNTVIIPLDGSALSERALALGTPLAAAFDAELHLVHVFPSPAGAGLAPLRALPDLSAARRYLDDVAHRLPHDLRVRTDTLHGDPVEQILQLAHSHPDAIVAMATHARHTLGRIAFGSVADQLVRTAPVPVALTGNTKCDSGSPFRTIVVPLDGSQLAETVLPLAVELAARSAATISLVRVVDPYADLPGLWYGGESGDWYFTAEHLDELEGQVLADARGYLERIAEGLRGTHSSTVWEVRTGQPVTEISRAAETSPAALILLASHGRGGVRRWALGSTTTALLHQGSAPVLVVPPTATTTPHP